MEAIVIFLLIFLSIGGGAPMIDTPCGDLSDADCQLVRGTADATFSSVETVALDGSIEIDFSSQESGIEESATVTITFDGNLGVDFLALEEYIELTTEITESQDPLNPQIAQEDVEALGDGLEAVMSTLETDIEITLKVTDTTTGDDGRVIAEFKFDNSIVYARVQADDEPQSEWVGIDLSTISEFLQLVNSLASDVPQEELDTAEIEELIDLLEGFEDNELMLLASDEEFWGDYITVTRLADGDVDGETTATFITEYDYAGALSDERFVNSLDSVIDLILELAALDPESTPPTDEEMAEAIEVLTLLSQALAEGIVVEETREIGTETGILYSNELLYGFEINSTELSEALGESPNEGTEDDQVEIEILIDYDLNDVNEAFEVEVPEDVDVISLATLLFSALGEMQ